jgi:hypothetical protein
MVHTFPNFYKSIVKSGNRLSVGLGFQAHSGKRMRKEELTLQFSKAFGKAKIFWF